jgi:hypothetical protein
MGKLEGYQNEDTSSITALSVASNPATSSPINSNIIKNFANGKRKGDFLFFTSKSRFFL